MALLLDGAAAAGGRPELRNLPPGRVTLDAAVGRVAYHSLEVSEPPPLEEAEGWAPAEGCACERGWGAGGRAFAQCTPPVEGVSWCLAAPSLGCEATAHDAARDVWWNRCEERRPQAGGPRGVGALDAGDPADVCPPGKVFEEADGLCHVPCPDGFRPAAGQCHSCPALLHPPTGRCLELDTENDLLGPADRSPEETPSEPAACAAGLVRDGPSCYAACPEGTLPDGVACVAACGADETEDAVADACVNADGDPRPRERVSRGARSDPQCAEGVVLFAVPGADPDALPEARCRLACPPSRPVPHPVEPLCLKECPAGTFDLGSGTCFRVLAEHSNVALPRLGDSPSPPGCEPPLVANDEGLCADPSGSNGGDGPPPDPDEGPPAEAGVVEQARADFEAALAAVEAIVEAVVRPDACDSAVCGRRYAFETCDQPAEVDRAARAVSAVRHAVENTPSSLLPEASRDEALAMFPPEAADGALAACPRPAAASAVGAAARALAAGCADPFAAAARAVSGLSVAHAAVSIVMGVVSLIVRIAIILAEASSDGLLGISPLNMIWDAAERAMGSLLTTLDIAKDSVRLGFLDACGDPSVATA